MSPVAPMGTRSLPRSLWNHCLDRLQMPLRSRRRLKAVTPVTLTAAVLTNVATLIAAGLLLPASPLAAQSGDPVAATARLLEDVAPALGWTRGSVDASITVVEFSDLSCPYCAQFHTDVRAQLIADFAEPSAAISDQRPPPNHVPPVRWITLSYVTGLYPNSLVAAEAVECAAQQGAHEPYLDRVYREREGWLRASRADALDALRHHAEALELDVAAWNACRNAPETRSRIRQINALAQDIGVRGTPTWVVDGFPVMGALPLDYARSFIEQRLQK